MGNRYAEPARPGGVRTVALLALLLGSAGTARAETREMRVATRDPALLSALGATFAPRGVRVTTTPHLLRGEADHPGTADAEADVIWLCGADPAAEETALCVRPRHGAVMVRRVAVATPLSPEDAAALALSVQVTLMPDATFAEAAAISRAAPPPPAAPPSRASDGAGAHALTLEIGGGARSSPGGAAPRGSVLAVFAPRLLDHHLGLGAGVAGGPTYSVPQPPGRGPGPPPPAGNANDLTLRLFARGAARIGPIRLELDLGPGAHFVTRDYLEPEHPSEARLHWSADGFAGLVIPFGRFFASARGGASYLLSGRQAPTNPAGTTWSAEALLTAGAGWF